MTDMLLRNPWLAVLVQIVVAVIVGLVLERVLHAVARRAAARFVVADRMVTHTRGSVRVLIPLVLVHLALVEATIPDAALAGLQHTVSVFIILAITALVVQLIAAIADVIASRHPTSVADNLQARSVQTQVRVLARTAMFVVGVLGVGSVLMTFPSVRQIGASLLASAGLAGLIAGFAARPVLGNLIAGLQIAITQPIRIDDVVIVENEWGRIEEITGTYVVVRIWDDRRLVVPLEYFIQNPFQNWTRRTSDLLGSVVLWVDFRMPLAPLRKELQRIVKATTEWDERVCVLQVVEVSERAMQLRILVSTQDAGLGWDLRCKVRERLIAYMQDAYPDYLPQVRATLLGDAAQAAATTKPEPAANADTAEPSEIAAARARRAATPSNRPAALPGDASEGPAVRKGPITP